MKAFLKWLRVRFPDSHIEVNQIVKTYIVDRDNIIVKYRAYVSNNNIFSNYEGIKGSWSEPVDTIAELKFEVNQYLKVKKEEELKTNNDEIHNN